MKRDEPEMHAGFGRALHHVRSAPGSKTQLGNGKSIRGNKKWKKTQHSLMTCALAIGALQVTEKLEQPWHIKSKVAVLQPGTAQAVPARSVQIIACVPLCRVQESGHY